MEPRVPMSMAARLASSHDARFVGPHERLLYLRSIPQTAALDPEASGAFALALRERWFRRGALLAKEDEPPRAVSFLVEGTVLVRKEGHTLLRVEPPNAVGFLSTLSGEGLELRAETDTITLELRAEDLLLFLEDHFTLLRNAFRVTGAQMARAQEELDLLGRLGRTPAEEGAWPEDPLDLVQRIEVLTATGPFADAALDTVVELARGAEEFRLEPGERLWSAGDPSTHGVQVVAGKVACSGRGGRLAFELGAGDVIGHLDAFAEVPRRYDAVAATPFVGLRSRTETFFDALEDNFGLARSFLGFMNRMLIGLYLKRAKALAEGG